MSGGEILVYLLNLVMLIRRMARNVKLTNFVKHNQLEGLFKQSLNHKPEKSALQISGQAQKFAFLTHAQVLLGPLA